MFVSLFKHHYMRPKLFICFLFLCAATLCHAQADTIKLRELGRRPAVITDRPPQAVYFQFGGSAPLMAANYDRRFANKLNGFGFAVGVGYWNDFGIGIFSIPVSLNYLFGRRSHFLELAAGTTFISAKVDWIGEEEGGSGFIQHINLGYRYQPAQGGFFFRGGVSPLFAYGEYTTSAYLGFGYNF